MLHLDYKLNPRWGEPLDSEVDGASELRLRYDLFLGDLEFVVYEMDLSAEWHWVPLLDFALALDAIVDALASSPSEPEVFEFTESDATISYERRGSHVAIDASYVPGLARVAYPELREATSAFMAKLVKELTARYPGLRSNPVLSRSFGGRE